MMGMVYLSWSVNRIRGVNRLFQLATKLKIAWVASAGFMMGRAILLKIYNSFAPSILAAWIISGDKDGNIYCLMKNTMDGAAILGRISARKLFVIPILYMNW